MSQYRELPKEILWGADLEVNVIDLENLKKHLILESEKLGKPIFGYRTYNTGSLFTYHMTRYPRTIKYPVGTAAEYENVARYICSKEAMNIKPPKIENSMDKPRFRVVMGLNQGYTNNTYSFEEVTKLPGDKFTFKKGKIMTVNYVYKKPTYEEPAIIIEGDLIDLKFVYQIADLYQQEGFAVELLDSNQAFMVETRHRKISDLDIKPIQT